MTEAQTKQTTYPVPEMEDVQEHGKHGNDGAKHGRHFPGDSFDLWIHASIEGPRRAHSYLLLMFPTGGEKPRHSCIPCLSCRLWNEEGKGRKRRSTYVGPKFVPRLRWCLSSTYDGGADCIKSM
ncbi:hypothetical protein SAMD00023353_6900290 [Rosellinia necatrix]|uniref:Uncharacterized protein n=1 Tax=Rosellinia necatrix TaxID=77044 RepID=A0A1S8AAG1_ROSNE|nr:hypothetical protein SAMD00023353_6900290 [Rosellinia necatrix]